MIHWKRPWCWERLKTGGEGDNRGWDDWMASLTQWTWICTSSENWWWTRKPDMLQSMGSQKFGHDWVTEFSRSHIAWMITCQLGCHLGVPTPRKICSPCRVCLQVSWRLWKTQLSVMWSVGLHLSVTANWCHGCNVVCFRTLRSVFVGKGCYIEQDKIRVLTSPLPLY